MSPAEKVDVQLARALADERNAIGFRQRDVAERMGLTQSAISLWENNRKPLTVGRFVEICDALGVDPCAVLGRALGREIAVSDGHITMDRHGRADR